MTYEELRIRVGELRRCNVTLHIYREPMFGVGVRVRRWDAILWLACWLVVLKWGKDYSE